MGSAAKKSVLAVDVGNTVTTLGLFDDGDLAGDWKLTTPAYLTADEAWLRLEGVLGTQLTSDLLTEDSWNALRDQVMTKRYWDPIWERGEVD